MASLKSSLLQFGSTSSDIVESNSGEVNAAGPNNVSYLTSVRRCNFFRLSWERINYAMTRISIRTYFILFLFIFAVATVSSVIDATSDVSLPQFKTLFRPREDIIQKNVIHSDNFESPDYSKYPWTFTCVDNKCQRQLADPQIQKVSFDVCWLTCGRNGPLWPAPVEVSLSKTTASFFPGNFFIRDITGPTDYVKSLVNFASNLTRQEIIKMAAGNDLNEKRYSKALRSVTEDVPRYHSPDSTILEVHLSVIEPVISITDDTDESYELMVSSATMGTGALVNISIKGSTFFGVRHGLETLSQLIAFDEIRGCLQIVDDVKIKDGPAFPMRGLMLDTARNFIPIHNIYRMVDSMSYNKLNTLHWHLTDSNSFPFYSKQVPQMAEYGAYAPDKIYTMEEIKDLVFYARVRGVKIIAEVDSPAHAGNGWQWGALKGFGDLAVCTGQEPWHSYCGQPPCGQLNPTNENVFIVLQKLYEDLLEVFDSDIFHIGGDEVMPQCWNQIPGIREWMSSHKLANHIEVWGFFMQRAYEKLREANQNKPISAVVWSSGLTASSAGKKFLNPENFIVQIWEPGNSQQVRDLLVSNYKIIFSNVDSMYLDFGGGTWLGTEHTYPYKNWQVFYDNDLDKIIERTFPRSKSKVLEKYGRQVLGGIATLWTEKVDENSMDSKLWPRGSAVAERLWSNPKNRRDGVVYSRLNLNTKRLKARGIRCATLQPESCLQMTGNCDDPDHHV